MNSKLSYEAGWSRPSGAPGKPGFGLLGRRSAVMNDPKIIPCAAGPGWRPAARGVLKSARSAAERSVEERPF